MLKKLTLLIFLCCVMIVSSACTEDNHSNSSSKAGENSSMTESYESERYSSNEPIKSEKTLCYYINKTLDDVKKEFGSKYTHIGYEGSTLVEYDDYEIAFILDRFYDTPTNDSKICYAISYGDKKCIEKLSGQMTYPEIVAAVNGAAEVGKPEKVYNAMDECWVYYLSFNYGDYNVLFEWENDPNTTRSMHVVVRMVNNSNVSSKPSSPSSAVSSASSIVDENALYINRLLRYMQKIDSSIYAIEFDTESDGIISCYIKSEPANYAYFGVEINKKTKEVTVYNSSGRIVDEFILPNT